MTAFISNSDKRSFTISWLYEHIVVRRTLLLTVLTLLGCLVTLGFLIHPDTPRGYIKKKSVPFFTTSGNGIDYYQFWVVGQAQKQLGIDDIYTMRNRQQMAYFGNELLRSSPQPSKRFERSVKKRQPIIETFSTPFLYAVIDLFSTDQYGHDYDHYMNICLSSLIFSIIVMGWLLHFTIVESLLFFVVVLLWCEPLASDLRVGNVNQLQLAGLALYLFSRRWSEITLMDFSGGFIMGLLVAFKPTLVVIPMMLTLAWIIDRRWFTLLRNGIGALTGTGVSFVLGCRFLNSWSAWANWANTLTDLEKVSNISVANGNYSLLQMISGTIETSSGVVGNISIILLTLMLILTSVALFLTRIAPPTSISDRQIWFERDFLVSALGCTLSTLTLKMVWSHYYILNIPLLLYVLRPGIYIKPNTIENSHPNKLLLTIVLLILSLSALVTVFGRPFCFFYDPDYFTMVKIYIGGAWGLMFLGLTDLWLSSSIIKETNYP